MDVIKKAEVIRRMRPLQNILADLIVLDVAGGNAPGSIADAIDRYCDKIGDACHFETNRDWSGDIRHAALHTLLVNGFAKGGVVRIDGDSLSWTTRDADTLHRAAQIETMFGGNRARRDSTLESLNGVRTYGEGSRAVYVYTDSVLDRSNLTFCKIGRHHFAEPGMVLARIVQQYRTGNPSFPILRYIFRTNDDAGLEGALHQCFNEWRVDGTGSEWFEMPYETVLPAAKALLAEQTRPDQRYS